MTAATRPSDDYDGREVERLLGMGPEPSGPCVTDLRHDVGRLYDIAAHLTNAVDTVPTLRSITDIERLGDIAQRYAWLLDRVDGAFSCRRDGPAALDDLLFELGYEFAS